MIGYLLIWLESCSLRDESIVFAMEIECFSMNVVSSELEIDNPRLYIENTSLVFESIDITISPAEWVSSI